MVKPEFRIYSFPSSEAIKLQIPVSDAPCTNCANKIYECNCSIIEENIGKHKGYSIKELESLKLQLDNVRNELDHIDIGIWQSFTRTTNIAQDIIYKLREIPVELATTGWCKLYEILHYFRWHEFINETEYHSMHLCECPGGFISALNHYIHSNVVNKRQRLGSPKLHWEWKANSLNPYFEGNNPNSVLTDDIIYRDTYRAWNMGVDDSGNITNTSNIDYIWQKTSKNVKNCWLADLVTADGSIDIQYNPNDQEKLTSSIQYCETVCALGLLRKHGSFILKCFNLLHHTSISLIALLCYCFQNVHIVKPIMSKGGNGEVYLIAMDFQGIRSVLLKSLIFHFQEKKDQFHHYSLFPREWLSDEFIEQCVTAATLFSRWQIDNINHNILKFKSSFMNDSTCKKIKINLENISSPDLQDDYLNNSSDDDEKRQKVHILDCGITKREKRIFALEYIQNLGINSIPSSQYIIPNRQIRKEYINSTSLNRKPGDRNRVQGIYIDRKYAFEQYEKLQKIRNDIYCPTVSFLKFKYDQKCKKYARKLLYLVDEVHIENQNQKDEIRDSVGNFELMKIPLKKKIDIATPITNLLPKEKFPKNIAPKWFFWSKDDIAYQRLIDRLKTQAYMFDSENFFKKVPSFSCCSLQMSPYCNEEFIQRYCETITAIKSPLEKVAFGIDTLVTNELFNDKLKWTTVPFDILKLLVSKNNHTDSQINKINKLNMHYNQDILRDILINDLPLLCQIPANNHILGLFETLRELKQSDFNYNESTMTEYLSKFNKYAEIYNGVSNSEALEDLSKFPLSYLLNINSKHSNNGAIIILSNSEDINHYCADKPKNSKFERTIFIDISKEFKYCSQYKQIISAITEDYNIQKNDYDLIYIDPYCHLVPTYSLGQFEIEEYFNLITDIMIALNLIKFGGNIIVSLKTILTRFTAGLIIVLSSVFDKIALNRPYSSSSPCFSNIHLICSGYNDSANALSRHFFQFLWDFSSINYKEKFSIIQCVPPTLFASDSFLHWLREFNNEVILHDIDLFETIIEQQQSIDEIELKISKSNNEDLHIDKLDCWKSYSNRINIQREILSFVLLGSGNQKSDLEVSNSTQEFSTIDEKISSDALLNKNIQVSEQNINENYASNRTHSNYTISEKNEISDNKDLFLNSENSNIDPFLESINPEIDVFDNESNFGNKDPFL